MGERSSSTMPYVPGIDGLRALALIAIFVFHLGIGWFPGAVFSVTLFFTLSGYLVTSLVLTEFASTGDLDLRRFWARRFRRLMPAALVAISAIGVCGLTGVFEGERLRGDVLWAIGYASNWRSAAASTSYSELFGAETSPLLHFWTLAIEEQFYILFPLAAWLLLRNRRLMVSVFVAVTALSVIATVLTSSRNLAYYGTHTRVAELTIGVLFAFVFPVSRTWSRVASRRWSIAGSAALVAFVVLLLTVRTTDAAVYKGALPAFALVATLLIAAVSVDGPMRKVFAWRPLVELGRVSYPAYLFHWPVIVALDEERLGFGGAGLQLVRVVVTLTLAFGTARLIEDPIRTRRVLRTGASAALAVGAALIATVVIGILVPSRSVPALAGVEAPDEVVAFDDTTAETPGSNTPEDPTAPAADTRSPIVVVGSEGRLAADLTRVAEGVTSGSGFRIVDVTQDGCAVRLARPAGSVCEPFRTVVGREVVASRSDIVVVGVGSAERDLLAENVERVMARPDNTWTADFVLVDESRKLVDRILDPVVGSFDRVIVVDYVGGDPLWDGLVDADLRFDELVALEAGDMSDDGAVESFDQSLNEELTRFAGEASDERARIMVIGDSSSFGIAQAIHNVAADRYEVVWAGGRNCPLVAVDRIRWFDGVEFDMDYCPTLESTWRSMIGDLRPTLVLEIASVPEQSEQMYEGDATWYTVDDPEFVARHDAVMTELVTLVGSVGGRLVLFDSPAVFGEGLGKAPFAQPDRIAAWNAMLAGWAARWPDIEVLEWSKIVDLVEEIPGELRTDDVHMEQDVLDDVVREHVVPLLDGFVSGEGSDPLGPTGP